MATTSSAPLSHSPYLRITASLFGAIFMGYGIYGFLNPAGYLSAAFQLPTPSSATDVQIANTLVYLYSIKEFLAAAAIFATAYYDDRKSLGWISTCAGLAAVGDGFVVGKVFPGFGEWNHWSYAPVLVVVGALLLGVADGSPKTKAL